MAMEKLGNRLTRRPCKGDEIDFRVSGAQTQNAGICRTCKNRLLIFTFISIGRRVTPEWKLLFRLRGDAIFVFKGPKKTVEIRISSFLTFASCPGTPYSSFLFFPWRPGELLPQCSRQGRCQCAGQGDIMTPSPTESPGVPFWVHLLFFFMEHGVGSPFFQMFPCSI